MVDRRRGGSGEDGEGVGGKGEGDIIGKHMGPHPSNPPGPAFPVLLLMLLLLCVIHPPFPLSIAQTLPLGLVISEPIEQAGRLAVEACRAITHLSENTSLHPRPPRTESLIMLLGTRSGIEMWFPVPGHAD